jgi:hypothetical protein
MPEFLWLFVFFVADLDGAGLCRATTAGREAHAFEESQRIASSTIPALQTLT